MKINQRYINEACRIREKYLSTLEEITTKEQLIVEYKDKIETILAKNTKYISDNETKDLAQIQSDIKDELLDIDININKIVAKLEPFFKSIEKLKNESKDLFISIKDKYPELTEVEIQEEIFKSIKR